MALYMMSGTSFRAIRVVPRTHTSLHLQGHFFMMMAE